MIKRFTSRSFFFAAPPIVCTILQIYIFGIAFTLNSVTLSLLIALLNFQNHSMYTDHLTGVNNRKKLDNYMKEKISACSEERTFSAILIDIDNFKLLNDTFGHDMGDDALETFVMLLRSCLRPIDFIARFGGDEFCIVLDMSNENDLQAAAGRINSCIEKYNTTNSKPYNLSISMGFAVYDYHIHMKLEEFQKQIDVLMYKDKQAKKENKSE